MTITTESFDVAPGHVGIVECHNRQMATVLQMLNDVKGTDAVPFVRRKRKAMDEIQNMFFRVVPHFFPSASWQIAVCRAMRWFISQMVGFDEKTVEIVATV